MKKKIKNSPSIEELKKKYGNTSIEEKSEETPVIEVKKSKIGKTEIYLNGKLHGSQG